MMKYLYSIRRGDKDYHFGKTDEGEVNVENLCLEECKHENPIESSDCFREQLLKNKPKTIYIESKKCCVPKCANSTSAMINYGYDFQFPVCKEHQNKSSIKKICGFGFQLTLKENN